MHQRVILILALVMMVSSISFAQLTIKRQTDNQDLMTVNSSGELDALGTAAAETFIIKEGTPAIGMIPFVTDATGRLVLGPEPTADGQVLKWDATNSQWILGTDDGGTTYDADGTTLQLSGTTFSAFNTTAQWNANQLRGTAIHDGLAPSTDGQVLKWDATASEWVVGADDGGTSYTADGTTLALSGTEFSAQHTVAQWNANQLRGTAIEYGLAPSTDGQVLKWDATASEWVVGADDGGTSYSADGTTLELSGTTFSAHHETPQWRASHLYNSPISSSLSPSDGQVLEWDGGSNQWVAAEDNGEVYTAGSGINISGGNEISALDTSPTNETPQAGTGISVSGRTVAAQHDQAMWNADHIYGTAVSSSLSPSADGQVLKWDDTANEWIVGVDNGEVYTAGSGINISGGNEISALDTSPTNETPQAGTGISVSGRQVSAQTTQALWNANQLRGTPISSSLSPSTGQVLEYNGTNWVAAEDNGEVYTAGGGININASNQISAVDQSTTNETPHAGTGISVSGRTVSNGYWSGSTGTSTTLSRSGTTRIGGGSASNSLDISYASGTGTLQGSGDAKIEITSGEVIITLP